MIETKNTLSIIDKDFFLWIDRQTDKPTHGNSDPEFKKNNLKMRTTTLHIEGPFQNLVITAVKKHLKCKKCLFWIYHFQH